MLSVALLSKSEISGCCIAQPSPCIAGDNVLKKLYARTTTRNQGLNQTEAEKIGYRMKTEKKNECMNFDLYFQGLLRKRWTKMRNPPVWMFLTPSLRFFLSSSHPSQNYEMRESNNIMSLDKTLIKKMTDALIEHL